MSQFAEFERSQFLAIKRKEERDLDCVSCVKCGGQWFEQIRCARYQADHNVVLGQPVPSRPGSTEYVMLKCAFCGNLHEPRVLHATRDIAGGDYDHFLDTMEGKKDKRAKESAPEAEKEETANEDDS